MNCDSLEDSLVSPFTASPTLRCVVMATNAAQA